MDQSFIPKLTFLTGQFLINFEKNKKQAHYVDVDNAFLSSLVTDPKLTEFSYTNPAVILMLSYGILVYPLGFWDKLPTQYFEDIETEIVNLAKKRNLPSITKTSELFKIINKPNGNNLSTEKLLKLLRNAISHSNVDFNAKRKQFTFWNMDRQGRRNFECSISIGSFSILLSVVGKFFSNAS